MAKEFLLKNESYFLLADAVGGVYNADQLNIIAGISESESAFLKITEDQALGLMVSAEVLPAVQESLRQAGLIPRLLRGTSQPSPRACLGELCPHCEQDALGDTISISSELAEAFPEGTPPLRIALNGCHQNCLASGTDDIHIVGEAEGYKLSIGGKAAELPQLGQFLDDNVQADELGSVLVNILRTYMDNRQNDESFHDFVERSGTSIFTQSASATEATTLDDTGLDSEHSADLLGDADLALAEEESNADELSPDEVDHLLGSPLDEDLDLEASALDNADLGDTELDDVDIDTPETDLDNTDLSSSDAQEALPEEEHDEHPDSPNIDDIIDLDELADLDISEGEADELSLNASTDAAGEHNDALSLMDDESGLEEAQATEDDLARVTQAMRSEAALDQADNASEGALTDLDSATKERSRPADGAAHSSGENEFETETRDEETETPDLPRSFLLLQDQATDAGSLQVKLIEDTICIVTPENARLNIPFDSLRAGLRVIVNLGEFSFSAVTQEGNLAVKFGLAAISIPLSSIASSADEQSAA